MSKLSCRLLLGMLIVVPASVLAAPAGPSHVVASLAQEAAYFGAETSVEATFTVENTGSEPMYVLDRELPFAGFKADLFEVRRDGEPVDYTGQLHRFAPARPVDYRRLEPGEQISGKIDLEGVYDFSRPGTYTVRFRGRATAFRKDLEGGFVPLTRLRRGEALQFDVERDERWLEAKPAAQLESATGRSVIPITFSCSTTRVQQIFQAVPLADQMATKALTALSTFGGPPNDYVKWFGAWNVNNQLGLFFDFANIQNTLDERQLWLYCDCTDAGSFAWTQKSTQGVIHLCPAFWNAPLTGFNSKADTLVHEVSHWPSWGGDTDDYAYGINSCLAIAAYTAWSLDNADSFAYFAADQP
jgi:peptidyl-Lys metalloendopeptidase